MTDAPGKDAGADTGIGTGTDTNPELRSDRWFGGDDLRSFSHRSRLRQLGYAPEDHLGKPVIAVLNTWAEINPCHVHLRTTGAPACSATASSPRSRPASPAPPGTA